MMAFTRKKEQVLKSLYTAHGRKKHDLCVCEGVRACREFLLSPLVKSLDFMLVSDDFNFPENFPKLNSELIFRIPNTDLKKITSTKNSQGILIVAKRPKNDYKQIILGKDPFAVLLEGISDPGNMGTILRTVKAVGLKKIYLTKGSVDPFSEKVIRSAMAAQFFLDIIIIENCDTMLQVVNIGDVKNIWRTDCHKGASLFEVEDLFDKSVIVFGSEATGTSEIINSKAVTIPMPGNSESINLAQSVTVFLFEAVRRKILRKD